LWLERGRHGDPRPLYLPDALLGWKLRPKLRLRASMPGSYDNVVMTIGRDGLRGKGRIARVKRPGSVRVGIFGCSQTFGEGVNDGDTYSARLENLLPDAEVLNFGVSGYGTDQMALYYESVGPRYGLDVVVLAFAYYHIERNLLSFRYFAKPRFEDDDGSLRLTGVPVPDPETFRESAVDVRPVPLLDHSTFAKALWQRVLRKREADLHQPDSAAWRLTTRIIARLADDVHRAGAQMVLMNIDEEAPQLDRPMEELADRLGIGFLNLGPVLGRIRGRGVRLRLRDNPHWSARGHEFIAEHLRDYLCDGMKASCPSDRGSPLPGAPVL
jgi:hypothetical protein